MKIIERLESGVRSYVRSFPTVFTTAHGSEIQDESGRTYLDFFAGAGALNYGHNHPALRDALLAYLTDGGVTHSLDMATRAKIGFLEEIERVLLAPREMDHRVLFPGPTGTNAVEAALKLARKVTGRSRVISFTNAFHGMTLGSLAATGNRTKRHGAGVPLGHTVQLPFDGYFGGGVDTAEQLETLLDDSSSGLDKPAAILLETIQAEGGVNVARPEWVRRVAAAARRHGALFIVDDIQVGCGRTGPFFSFDEFGVEPDIVCLSKSLSGFGLPLAVVLVRPEFDRFSPGEHNGTFRGNNHAFVTGTEALRRFWATPEFARETAAKADLVGARLDDLAARHGLGRRGRGMIQGLVFPDAEDAGRISAAAFRRGLIVETAGPDDEVLKLLPPLNTPDEQLERGLDLIEESLAEVMPRGATRPVDELNGTGVKR